MGTGQVGPQAWRLAEGMSMLTRSTVGCFQKLASPNLSRMVQECLLEEAAQQKQVLETLSMLDFEKVSKVTSIEESK